jgi:type I restriction enzyme R subunit
VQVAVGETLRAAELRRAADRVSEGEGRYEAGRRPGGKPGDRRVGVVWHTQGSGKSLTMAFYAGRIIREPAMENPTLVVLTDRNDLDDQLFGTFSRCQDLLRQPPVQAESRAHLRDLLSVAAGGVSPPFTSSSRREGRRHPTPEPQYRGIADEAHRSQYDFIDGYARHMRALPHARSSLHCTPIAAGRQHARGLRRLHRLDIQPPCGRCHGADLLRAGWPPRRRGRRPKIDPEFEEATEARRSSARRSSRPSGPSRPAALRGAWR